MSKLNQCDVFVLLWGLYNLQGVLYSPGIFNQCLVLVLILMGFYSLICYIKGCMHTPLLNCALCLVAMFCVYGIQNIMFGNGVPSMPASRYLKFSLISLLPIFFFFIQSQKGNLDFSRIIIYTFFLLAMAFGRFYLGEQNALADGIEETTNNAGYNFVKLLPLIYFLYKKPLLQYGTLAVIIAYVLMGMKRGAILIGCVCVLIFLFSGLKEKSDKRRFATLLLSIIIVIGTIYGVRYMLDSSAYFVSRVEATLEGDSSNRDILYSSIWNYFIQERNIFYFVFGHGADSTVRLTGTSAHQDWLEIAFNNGLLGLSIFLVFNIVFGVAAWKCRKYFPPYMFYSFCTLFFICFSATLFSMSITEMSISQTMLIGYFSYNCCRLKQNQRI